MKVSLLILLMLSLTACSSNESLSLSDKIKAPKNIRPPLEGKWRIESYKLNKNSGLTEKAAKTYLGKEILIDKELVAVAANFTLEPSFKIKNVKTVDYLMYQYQVKSPKFLDIESEEIQVVSISGADQFFYEFLVVEKDKAFINIDGVFFNIVKTRDKVEEEIIAEYYYKAKDKGTMRMVDNEDATMNRTGLLIGIKSPVHDSVVESWDYKTIFLRFDNRKVKGAYERENLFVPRKNGFWNINVSQNLDDEGKIESEYIYSEPRKKGMDTSRKQKYFTRADNKTLKNILYIGNDYISIENVTLDDDESRYLEFFPLDNVNKGKSLKISDVIGESGSKVFLEGMYKDDEIRENKELIEEQNKTVNEQNFGLFRRNGHWILKGRVNFNKNNKNVHRDFFIKSLIPDDIISYDELNIPWYAVRMKVPEAKDAFVSPNEDVIVIQTNNSLMVYALDNGDIGDVPLMKTELKMNESIVMKEWARGHYSNNWEEEFLKGDFKVIEYK